MFPIVLVTTVQKCDSGPEEYFKCFLYYKVQNENQGFSNAIKDLEQQKW